MSAFPTAMQDFLEAIETESHREIGQRAHRVLELVEHIDDKDASWALMSLVPLLADPHCPYHAMTACLCEPMMRQGGDPWLVTGLVIERLRDTLRNAAEFRQEFRRRCREVGVDAGAEMESRGEVWKGLARERGWQAYVSGSLELFCMPALPILIHFPQARAQLRLDLRAVDDACVLAGEVEEVGELVRLLEQHPEPDEPQAAGVEDSLAQLRQSLEANDEDRRAVANALMQLYRSLFAVDLATRNLALRGLAGLIEEADVAYLGDLGQLAGSIVETGGDPVIALDAILARLPVVLRLASEFVQACRHVDGAGDIGPVIERHGEVVAETHLCEANAFQAAGPLCLGAIAMLSRSVEARKHVSDDPVLLELAGALGEVIGPASFLWKMVQVLDDEEILVFDPERERGWRVKIRGVADNFQLHTLLAGALVGPEDEGFIPATVGVARNGQREDAIPGRPLDQRAVGLATHLPCTLRDLTVWSHLQLWTWQALQANETLPDDPVSAGDWFVFNEGVPADIPLYGDTRVVLIGPAAYLRSWNGGRVFHGMEAELDVEESLDVETVRNWLHRFATTPRAE